MCQKSKVHRAAQRRHRGPQGFSLCSLCSLCHLRVSVCSFLAPGFSGLGSVNTVTGYVRLACLAGVGCFCHFCYNDARVLLTAVVVLRAERTANYVQPLAFELNQRTAKRQSDMFYPIVQRVLEIAERAGSEAKLQIGLDHQLRELLVAHGIPYNPTVNETLRKLGYSQVSSDRPDSLFGHVVLDYKNPGDLSVPPRFAKAKEQIERYLNTVTDGGPSFNPSESARWAGVLWDGFHLAFCRSSGLAWTWSRKHETSESSLLSLVQIYRSLGRLPLTANLLTRRFGKDSDVAKAVLPVMCSHLSKPRHRTTMLFHEWRRLFQQVSTYGLSQLPSLKDWARRNGIATTDASQILFAMHTYYSLVVKLLTAELLAASQTISPSLVDAIANAPDHASLYGELARLENGDFYRNYRISNFLEGDFFSWYTNEESVQLAESLRALAHGFQEFEPATAKLRPETIKDLLKEFYSSLVDEQIRHDLGEYYTPDWLAEYVVDAVGYNGEPGKIVVDPACGSGTFLVECISRLRSRCDDAGYSPLQTLQMVLHCVRGLDLNPLAVVSARANYVLSVADLVFALGHDVEIPVYLADSINVPVERPGGILEYTLDTEVEDIKFGFPLQLVRAQVLGRILLKCEDDIGHHRSSKEFLSGLKRDQELDHLLDEATERRLAHFYEAIQGLHNRVPPWDTIWCRIVKNNFSPRGFEDAVDYIVGNPPWVRWSRLPSTYRRRVKRFCDYYGLVSGRGYTGGIESDIATVLTFSAVDHWLRPGGRIGFLITWTVFKSDSARGFRLGRLPDSSGIRIDQIEDLTALQPFPDASNETGIYVATKVGSAVETEFFEIPCREWRPRRSARIDPSLPLFEVLEQVSVCAGAACPVAEFGSPLFTGKKADYDEVKVLRGESEYLTQAHRGTVSDLARVFWVKVEKYSPETNRALIRTLREDELRRARWVEPVEGAWIEADVLFPLLRGREVGRYCARSIGWYQIVPNRHYAKFETEEEFADKYPATYSYLLNYADLLPKRSTYRRYQKGLPIYSIYCIGEYSFHPYKVVWLEQQSPKTFRAAVVTEAPHSLIPNNVIVPDHKLYFASVDSLDEAHYLCAFLNSHPVRTWLGGFLLGKQIGTTIFRYMGVPRYNAEVPDHRRLAEISMAAHEKRLGTGNKGYLSEKLERELEKLVHKIARE